MNASPTPGDDEGGLLTQVDARALTSLAALLLAMGVVCVIAIVGHLRHGGNASNGDGMTADSMPPLVNLGVEVPAPAMNVGRPEASAE